MVGALIVLPVAAAENSGPLNHTSENDLRFTDFPQLYINATSQTSFNVSLTALLLFANHGVYVSLLPNERWDIARVSNNSLYYEADIHFTQINNDSLDHLETRFNVTNLTSPELQNEGLFSDEQPLTAHVIIYMNKTYVSDPVNGTQQSNTLTGFRITFTLTSSDIKGPGSLILIQQLGARIDRVTEPYHALANLAKSLVRSNDTGLEINSSNYDAYYWWNSTYMLNGHDASLGSVRAESNNIGIVLFKYDFNRGLKSIVQDPYFSIPQINLFNNPIIQGDIQNATQFILLHAELFVAGLGVGAILLGISYGSYRKRRF